MLRVKYIRDGRNQIVGSQTSGFAGDEVVARDRNGRVLGRSSDMFKNTRDASGKLISRNTNDVRLLFGSERH